MRTSSNRSKKTIEEHFMTMNLCLEMGQSIAIIEPLDKDNKSAVQAFKKEIVESSHTIHINFDLIDSSYALAKIVIQQCEELITKVNSTVILDPKLDGSDTFRSLDKAFVSVGEIANDIDSNIILFAEHFSAVLDWSDGKEIQEIMRGIFQMEDNVNLVFTGDKESFMKIFFDRKAAFFRYVRIVDIEGCHF